jgi:hypothetical protein
MKLPKLILASLATLTVGLSSAFARISLPATSTQPFASASLAQAAFPTSGNHFATAALSGSAAATADTHVAHLAAVASASRLAVAATSFIEEHAFALGLVATVLVLGAWLGRCHGNGQSHALQPAPASPSPGRSPTPSGRCHLNVAHPPQNCRKRPLR